MEGGRGYGGLKGGSSSTARSEQLESKTQQARSDLGASVHPPTEKNQGPQPSSPALLARKNPEQAGREEGRHRVEKRCARATHQSEAQHSERRASYHKE